MRGNFRTMLGYWHHDVVRLCVRPSVTLCIVAFRVGVQGESCTSVFSTRN